jgi:class 3 adenylate cyclase
MEYTAIGSTVNRAARLQALSVGGRRVVVSERCAVNVGRTKPELVPLGEVLIKGVPAPTRIYTFRAPSQPGLPIGATNVSSAEMSPSTPLTPTGRS